jgi:hypothetical protein
MDNKELSRRLKLHNNPKGLLAAFGFRPVRRDEVPDHDDEIINCNVLYDRSKKSATTFEHALVHRPTSTSEKYSVNYTTTVYAHTYSKSWFEKVMWIRKKQEISKPTEQVMEERNTYMVENAVYINTTRKAIEEVLLSFSNANRGKKIVCYKLVEVAVAFKPEEPKQVQWL